MMFPKNNSGWYDVLMRSTIRTRQDMCASDG